VFISQAGFSHNYTLQADSLHSDLASIVTVWPDLPEHIKQAIRTLAGADVK
jgi:hypothetical protein